MNRTYDDIIGMKHPASAKHTQMPLIKRAAQFAPFAALTGYDSAIEEAARRTCEKREADEYEKDAMNRQLALLLKNLSSRPAVRIKYFVADARKPGGKYVTVCGVIKKYDRYNVLLVLEDGKRIPVCDILKFYSDLSE